MFARIDRRTRQVPGTSVCERVAARHGSGARSGRSRSVRFCPLKPAYFRSDSARNRALGELAIPFGSASKRMPRRDHPGYLVPSRRCREPRFGAGKVVSRGGLAKFRFMAGTLHARRDFSCCVRVCSVSISRVASSPSSLPSSPSRPPPRLRFPGSRATSVRARSQHRSA